MAIARERGRLIFRKMEKDLIQLSKAQEAEDVHNFRTTARRLETLMEQLLSNPGRRQKKLLKMVDRVRRRAGRVRDVDVQLAALRSLKVSLEPRRKTRLMQNLLELRARHEKKLRKSLSGDVIEELRKRLKRAARAADFESGRDPLATAKHIVAEAITFDGEVDEELLHRCRLAVKRARYAAEFSTKSPESAELIAQLRRLQDALGTWHDWLTLTDTAVEQLSEVNQSPLVAALHNVMRGKFRQAVDALAAWQARSNGTRLRKSESSGKPASKASATAARIEPAA